MSGITPCLWFDGQAEEAASFYVSIFPHSSVDQNTASPVDNPSNRAGDLMTVEFTLAGQRFIGLNGGPDLPFSEAISFSIDCADQAEVDRYWDALLQDGGTPGPCGWLKDRFGASWQVVPRQLPEMLASADRAAAGRAMQAMLKMEKLDVSELRSAYEGV